ncbi:hypothetical protein HYH02_010097 [Chlamydomonas schloesseri]|uniref:EGF-like domain-containing protein n=1 Tax=Chlamydomonas schloesseri TaxID=2026947 RepID=A0A835W8F4_9CHLO|nr:hypothetical protein HYH02_010097 [Chlamydomonas schloesseri]|eukprot:KAG2441254.1 hypothetical protein HYH02_010097 [Chlamydomonas schloesseri]
MVAKGVAPNVSLSSGNEVYSPSRGSGFSGTQQDGQAELYSRTYHRVFVARNTDSSRPGMPTANSWFVTVANMERQLSVFNYKIRVTCLPSAAQVPCPSPAPLQPACSGRGNCLPALPKFSFLYKTCQCQEGWGDYDCWRPVPLLANGATATAVMQPNTWAYWQLRVPLPPVGGIAAAAALPRPPALLVELNRGGAAGIGAVQEGTGLPGSGAGGGDPLLLVVPKPQSGSNQVPGFYDVSSDADLLSYFMQQALHYRLLRNPQLFLAAPFTSPENRTADFYVAVYNNNQRFVGGSQQPNQVANVTLRVRWTDLKTAAAPQNGTSSPPPPLCPGSCFGRGTCYDPQDPANAGKLPPPLLPPLPAVNGTTAKPADFQCACTADAGGTMCEGVLVRANLTRATGYSSGPNLAVAPGHWRYFVVQPDSRSFDYRYQQLSIGWVMRDRSPANASAYVNAFITINEQAFPRDSDLNGIAPFRRGWQIFYSTLAQRANPPLPLVIRGTDLTPGLSYVFGLYNSDYLRQVPYTTSLTVEPVAASPPPRPPRPPRPALAIPPQPPGQDWWWWVATPPPTEGEEHGGSSGGEERVRRPPPARARRLPPGWRYHAKGPGGGGGTAGGAGRQQMYSPPAMRVVSGSRQDAGRVAPPPAASRRRASNSGGQ